MEWFVFDSAALRDELEARREEFLRSTENDMREAKERAKRLEKTLKTLKGEPIYESKKNKGPARPVSRPKQETLDAAVDFIRENGEVSTTMIEEALSISNETANRTMRTLNSDEIVRIVRTEDGIRPIYALMDDPKTPTEEQEHASNPV